MDDYVQRSRRNFQELQNAQKTIEKFENSLKSCLQNDTPFVDSEFYPQIPYTNEDQDKFFHKDIKWHYIEEKYQSELFDNISSDSISQGDIGNCYLISSFIYLSQNKYSVQSLFHPKSSLECGCVLVYFYFMGHKIPVLIDTQIPFLNDNETPIFSHPKTHNDSFWFTLVEKAFAKLYGSYSLIETNGGIAGIRLLTDFFSVAYGNIRDMLPINNDDLIFNELIRFKQNNAMLSTSTSIKQFPAGLTKDDIRSEYGIILDHAYQISNVGRINDKNLILLKNPWGTCSYKNAYHDDIIDSEADENNGCFWMEFNDYLKYFDELAYALPTEKEWKCENVYGKICGYLDGREPFENSKCVGCIPQWKIKFSKKAVVRLSFDIAGPMKSHRFYICQNHGCKVSYFIDDNHLGIESNGSCNGIEYNVNDPNEYYTFFLTRTQTSDYPCYFRIKVESPDDDFVVEQFDDNWNNDYQFSKTGVFYSNEYHLWNPYGSRPLNTCRQYYITFPNQGTKEIRLRIYKTITKEPLIWFLAKSDNKIGYYLKGMEVITQVISAVSEYEEYSLRIETNKNGETWIFGIYRDKPDKLTKFKFYFMSSNNFSFGIMPESNPYNDCCYTISGKLESNENDGASPFSGSSVINLTQWNLKFLLPTKLIINYYHNNSKSDESLYLQMKDELGQKIDKFFKTSKYFEFDVDAGSDYDQIICDIKDVSKPYALCVTRVANDSPSEFKMNLFAREYFDMNQIDGPKAQIYKPNLLPLKEMKVAFDEIKPIDNKDLNIFLQKL